ncbi:MAG TPA: DMT family transporter [Anaerolineaceae bacterium]|nr:DMT family transporter [Anaerolineaceae bacterium]
MKPASRFKGIQSALASAVFLGMAPIFGKQAILFGFQPMAVVFFRTGIAFLLILGLMAVFKRKFFYIYPVGLIGCVLAGVVNGLGSIFYYVGLSRLNASVGQLIYSFYPLFLAFWLLLDRQPIKRLTILRLLLAVPGVILLISASHTSIDLVGALFMFVSAVLYALHLLINQRVLYEVPAPTVTLYTLLAMSATVTLAFFLFDGTMPAANLNWWPILGMALITFFSRITLFLGVKHLGGLQTAILGLGELLITVLLAHWWLGESLTPFQWGGALLLILSMFLVGFDKYSPTKRYTSGWLSWLNPPEISPTDLQSPP